MYMCDWGGQLAEPWNVVCCRENENTSVYCQPNDMNFCTPTFEKADFLFYTYCPGIGPKMCGEMKVEATTVI